MKKIVFQAIIKISIIYLLVVIAGLIPTASFADDNQNLTIQNVELHPGDVINLRDGAAIYINAGDTGGHAAMYLGIVDDKQKFLDFTITKKIAGEDGKFRGRILNAEEFLNASSKSHADFDVFRLKDMKVEQGKLAAAAKKIAEKQNWVLPSVNGFSTTCAGAVAQVLSASTPKPIGFTYRPDRLTDENGLFERTSPVTVNIGAALSEIKGVDNIIGTWNGTALSSESQRFNVNLTIQNVAGGTGDFGGCGGTLSGGSAGSNVYRYNLNITDHRRTTIEESGCVDGTVILNLRDGGRDADYRWDGRDVDGTQMFSDGVLHKTSNSN